MNYVFFIGGSGARAYTAFLHACAAGVVCVDKVSIMLLDADSENAACDNSCRLFRTYSQHREMLNSIHSPATAFHCDVKMYQERAISPVYDDITYLGKVSGGNSTRDRVLKWFYTKEEISQDLKKGFFSHPNIGCMFFQNFGNNQSLRHCMDDIVRDLSQGEETRVVIVGSVFGGTGAAGIPSIQKILEEYVRDVPTNNLHCSGIFITPYFKVTKAPSDHGLTINSDEFYGSTKAALVYYRFVDKFEKIYLVGQNTLELVNDKYADGGTEQNNKPHIVEVSAAMAVKDFLEGDVGEKQILGHFFDFENENERITWASFGADMYRLADMLRTQMVLETIIYPCAIKQPNNLKSSNYQWCRVFCTGSVDSQQQLEIMQEYSKFFFEWLYHLQHKYLGVPVELCVDTRIELCKSDILSQLWNRVEARKQQKICEPPEYKIKGWRKYQQDFTNLVETGEKFEYVVKKVGVLLSALGVLPRSIAALNCAGLFLKLFCLTKHTPTSSVG